MHAKRAAAGTKRKAAPAAASRGVEALKKANTEGMAKMTSFFKPKEPKEAKGPKGPKK